MPFLRFRKIWEDYDSMVQLELQASSDLYSATQDFYVYPEELLQWATRLREFPSNRADTVTFEVGSEDPKVTSYLFLRSFVHDSVGHSAIEVRMDNHSKPPYFSSARFFILCEPALLNDFGKELASWVASKMSETLVREWKNA